MIAGSAATTGIAGIAAVGGMDANGDASAQMDREFSADIYQAEEAQGLE